MKKIDLGCGPNKKEGFIGVDVLQFPGVDIVHNLGKDPWPFEDGSVDEAHCSHMLEHLTWPERIHFFNELHRVMVKGAKGTIIIPHWASNRYYGDPTHQAPIGEMAFYYLLRSWRDSNAPHVPYTCDFDATWGYNVHPAIATRNPEYQQYAVMWLKEAAQDLVATVVKR